MGYLVIGYTVNRLYGQSLLNKTVDYISDIQCTINIEYCMHLLNRDLTE